MAQDKNSSKLNEVQEVGVKRQDFLKRVIESFCQKLKDVATEMAINQGG